MNGTLEKELSGWGRYPRANCKLSRPERYADLQLPDTSSIARGQGRAYGDAALNSAQSVVLTERLNRLLQFDLESGVVRAEAGLTLEELLSVTVPHGWFPKVTPGTKFVSLGGCVAADVHGKNHHHLGAFSECVLSLELITAAGERVRCSREEKAGLFWATIGGMGLTGIIGEVELQLQQVNTAYIQASHHAAANLKQALELFDEYDSATYSVAWIDLLAKGSTKGRSVVMLGEHARAEQLTGAAKQSPLDTAPHRKRKIPFDMPGWLLNPLTIGGFNALYYRLEGGKRESFIVDYDKFFYPLDALSDWNRLYGKQGFLQYQCVVPKEGAYDSLSRLLDALASSKQAAFLGVLKKMGMADQGLLSFPMEGYTLALDLPYKDEALLTLLDEFDSIVTAAGGRVYLAKDARMKAEGFNTMYPAVEEFMKIKQQVDPQGVFVSDLARRLGMVSS